MKALILAGGRGTRLRPITNTINKHLIPVGGVPMIERALRDVIEIGVKEIIINVNKGDTEIKTYLENSKKWNVKFDFIEQERPNGCMYPIIMSEKLIGNEDFLLYMGDNIFSQGIKNYYKEFLKNGSDAHLLVSKVSNPEKFGVAVIKDGYMIKTVEKPQTFISDLAVTGVYFYKSAIFKAMKKVKPILLGNSSIPEYYPPPAHQWLIDNGFKITVSEITGWWKDTGQPEALILANQLVLKHMSESETSCPKKALENSVCEGSVFIGKNSVLKNSKVRGPVYIGDNCVIEDSFIGPYSSISNGVQVVKCDIENSVIMENSKILCHDKRIDSSIIGRSCTIEKSENRPQASNLFLGEFSIVKL